MGDVYPDRFTELLTQVEAVIKQEPVESVEAADPLVQPESSSLKEEQFNLEEDEIKPPLAVFLLPEQEVEAVSDEKDPLAQSNADDAPVTEVELISTDGSGDGVVRGRRLACGCCGKQFTTRQHETTLTYIHTTEEPFTRVPLLHACAVCVKLFRDGHADPPSGERPFACSTCPERFAQRAHLTMHVRTHAQEKPFACYACDKRFSSRGSLVAHWRTHTVEKSFACDACGIRFGRKQALDGHLLTNYHSKNSAKAPVCTLCGKRFPHSRSLACHMRYTHWKDTRSSADTHSTT